MDYENLLHLHVGENTGSNTELYRPVKSKDDISPAGKVEFEKAKNMLSVVSRKSNRSLYDHLAAILQKILRHGIEDAVDKLEDISFMLKDEKRSDETEIIEVTPPNEVLLKFIEDKKSFYKLTPVVSREEIKTAEDEEAEKPPAEVEEVESEVDVSASLSDLYFRMQRFSQAGIGLSPVEIHDLVLTMKDLIEKHRIEEVRFWGKVFAKTSSYYILESKYSSEVTPEDFGWKKDKKQEEEEEKDENEEEEETAEKVSTEEAKEEEEENAEGEEDAEADEDDTRPKIPPLPERKPPKRKFVPSEEGGHGVNERLYFASNKVDGSYRCLPLMKPFQITEARRVKRFFTGNLEAEIGGGVPFSGKEAHYLRAQIARISASTFVAPVDYYEIPEEEDEEEPLAIVTSESYEAKSVMEMLTEGLEAWVHYKPAILDQGRCSPMQEGEEDEEEEEDEDEEEENEDEEGSERFEAKKEVEVPKLRGLSEDEAIGNLQPWNIKLSSKLAKKVSIMILQSNLWPGAFTFYDGKSFDHIYIGFGYKFSTFHFGPTIPIVFQKEYESGSDILETEDVEVEDEPPEEAEEGDNEEKEPGEEEEDEEEKEPGEEDVEEEDEDE